MKKNQTDSTIVLLLTLAIVFSIGGVVLNYVLLSSVDVPVLSVTGRVTDSSSTVTLTQSGTAGITLTDNAIAFGSGYYNASCTQGGSLLESNLSHGVNTAGAFPTCWINTTAFLPVPDFHTIQNNGSVKVNVSAYGNQQDADSFYCGSPGPNGCPLTSGNGARIRLMSLDNEAGSCLVGLTGYNYKQFIDESANYTTGLCNGLDFSDASDSIDVYVRLNFPRDATAGLKTLTITYQALAI